MVTKTRRLGSHGYIGPMGDDFPSIFPLLLGLVVFFSALYTAYATYQTKNDIVQTMRANILISRAIRYQVVFDEDYWKSACNLALGLRGDYQVHLAMWVEEEEKGNGPPGQRYQWKIKAVCPQDDEFWSGREDDPKTLTSQLKDTKAAITMTYPIVWKGKDGVSTPARLTVVTWR